MKNCLFTLVLALAALTVTAQQFDDCFDGRTLRLDYVFAGNHDAQQIYLEQMSVTPQWAGRRSRLADVPLAGNGQIQLKDPVTGQLDALPGVVDYRGGDKGQQSLCHELQCAYAQTAC